MLKIARALLFIHGFRPADGQQHKTTVDVAGKILGREFRALIEMFDKMRKKRNQFTYDPMLPLSLKEAENALKTADKFYKMIKAYLDKKYPQLSLFN
jgi:uncharacterized protein (UPF0332 family)